MEKEKGKKKEKENIDKAPYNSEQLYRKLVHIRWKALIRSKEYRDFLREFNVVENSRRVKSLLSEIRKKEKKTRCVGFSFDEQENNRDLKLAHEVALLESVLLKFKQVEAVAVDTALSRFGLMKVGGFEGLLPKDKRVEQINFSDYLHKSPDTFIRELMEAYAVVEYKENSELSSFLLAGGRHKLFLINPNTSFDLIVEGLKKLLEVKSKPRKDRKEFDSWEKAIKVWDIHQQEKNELKTAKRMGWKFNRKGVAYTNEDLRSLVSKKLEVAEKLIALAGQGKFIIL